MASVPLQARALLGWDKEDFVAAMESLTLEQRIPILEVCAAYLAPGGAINFLSLEARKQIQQTIKDTLNAGDPVSDTHNNAESFYFCELHVSCEWFLNPVFISSI